MADKTPNPAQGQSFSKSKRIGQAIVREITLVSNFKEGYRNLEDITNLPPGVLVVGSQNVLVNTASRLQARLGYVLDGDKSTVNAPILSSFEWHSKTNGKRWVRFGFLTSAGNDGKLQYRYTNATGVVWNNLATGISNSGMNFTSFWDTSELIRVMLYVNGNGFVNEWSGAYDTVSSVASGAVTMTNPIATTGWYNKTSAKQKFLGNGTLFTYTGATGSVFSGVTPNPQSVVASGDVLTQAVYSTLASGYTSGPPSTYNVDLIATLLNQVFLGSLTSPTLYMSKTNNYTDYSFSSPRIPADGATANLDDNLVAFIPQEDVMYISAGLDYWYNTQLVQSTSYNGAAAQSITTETFQVKLLKNNNLQGAQSQSLVNNKGNKVLLVQNEPAFEELGRMENIFAAPQIKNLSDPIKNDFDNYDFTGGSVYSWRNYNLIAIPRSGIVRIYNKIIKAWEAPQTIPVTSFYVVGNNLYGHSSTTSESYKLFSGNSDRATATSAGNPFLAQVNFSYQNEGTRTVLKNANKFYIEGYISGNTTLNCTINYEQDGNLTTQTFQVLGDDTAITGGQVTSNSLGKNAYGQSGLGSQTNTSLTGLPPKFRVIKTFPRFDFYEMQFSFNILEVDQNFQLLAFGLNAAPSDTTSFYIEE
jgi:hypothetical protein